MNDKRALDIRVLLISALVAVVPSTLGSILSYMSSKNDQATGYTRIVETVDQQGKILEELVKEVNYLRGRADGERASKLRLDSSYISVTTDVPKPLVPKDPYERVLQLRPLPKKFSDALK